MQAEPEEDIDVPIVVTMWPHEAQLKLMIKLRNQRVFTQTAFFVGENEGELATGEGWMNVLRSDLREPDRCRQDRVRKHPDCWVSGS